jgi:glycosyltransferase involved in cell wall biosynthesis
MKLRWFFSTIPFLFLLFISVASFDYSSNSQFFQSSTQKDRLKLLIICDVWNPDGGTEEVINQITKRLLQKNVEVKKVTSKEFIEQTFGVPNLFKLKFDVEKLIQGYKPDKIVLVSAGAIAHFTSMYCNKQKIPFTIFYSTKIPEFSKADSHIPLWLTYKYLEGYLSKASNVLVPTVSVGKDLNRLHGADTSRFHLYDRSQKKAFVEKSELKDLKRPFYLYVGRLCKAKNIDAFLNLSLPGTKIMVGRVAKGYNLEDLKKTYPDVVFTGPKFGEDLEGYYASSDVFVFPSVADTFGLVQLEALASGLPLVAFNVTGPKDIAPNGSGVSYLAEDSFEFQAFALKAWEDKKAGIVTSEACRAFAEQFSWEPAVDQLLESIPTINW